MSGTEPHDASPVVPGYTLEALLGRGGSGEVWRAVPRRGGAAVAVKVLVAGDPERQAREAALLGELDHPHLVRLIEVVHQPRRGGEPRVALVLELLGGGSLADLLARRGRLRPGEVVTAIAPVAAALAHAHGQGVVHGDLSPGNIVFTAEGRPVLTDLGVARVLGETSAGEVTPAYVDPTVARGSAPGPASDVFGVAAAAFHALTGIAPWNAATPADTLAVAAAGELPDLAELAPEAPPALIEVLRRGLAPDPHDRGTAAAFALDLRHACRPEPVRLAVAGGGLADLADTGRGLRTELTHQVPGRRPRPAPVVVEPPRRRVWSRPAGRGALVGVAVAVLAAAAWLTAVGFAGGSAEDAGTPVAAATGRPEGASSSSAASSADPPAPAADRQQAPGSAEGWRAVVDELYRRRGAAFAAGSAEALADVYVAASAAAEADAQHLAALTAAGEVLRGFAPTVVRVTAVGADGGRVSLDVVDRRPDYAVVPASRPDDVPVRTVEGRGDAAVRLVLFRTALGWRIESGERLA
jgi:hypothetical protein